MSRRRIPRHGGCHKRGQGMTWSRFIHPCHTRGTSTTISSSRGSTSCSILGLFFWLVDNGIIVHGKTCLISVLFQINLGRFQIGTRRKLKRHKRVVVVVVLFGVIPFVVDIILTKGNLEKMALRCRLLVGRDLV